MLYYNRINRIGLGIAIAQTVAKPWTDERLRYSVSDDRVLCLNRIKPILLESKFIKEACLVQV